MSQPDFLRPIVKIMERILLCCLLTLSACAPRFVEPEGLRVTPAIESDHFVSFDGTGLPLRSWAAEGKSKAVLIALHGFNDYSNFITDAAVYFSDNNLSLYAYDQRGFGMAPQRGRWPGKQAFAQDLYAFVQTIREKHPGQPLFLLGESMGAAVVLHALATSELNVDGVILCAPAVMGWHSMPWWQRAGLTIAAHTMPWSQFTGQSLGIVASSNREMLMALGRDPLVIKATRVDTIYGLVNLMQAGFEAVRQLKAPALILYGEKDEVIPKASVLAAFGPLSAANRGQQLYLYKNGYHMLLRDLQAEVLWQDIVSWINNRAIILRSEQLGLSKQYR